MSGGHSHGSHSEGTVSPAKKLGSKLNLVYVGVGILIVIMMLNNRWSRPVVVESGSTATQSAASSSASTQVQSGTKCPLFSTGGATCDLDTERSAWITADDTGVVGHRLCWTGDVSKVEYLKDGKPGVLNPGDALPEGIQAMRFTPNGQTTLTYRLAAACRTGTASPEPSVPLPKAPGVKHVSNS